MNKYKKLVDILIDMNIQFSEIYIKASYNKAYTYKNVSIIHTTGSELTWVHTAKKVDRYPYWPEIPDIIIEELD